MHEKLEGWGKEKGNILHPQTLLHIHAAKRRSDKNQVSLPCSSWYTLRVYFKESFAWVVLFLHLLLVGLSKLSLGEEVKSSE